MSYPTVTVQNAKAVSARFRHPWIFSGALTKRPDDISHGSLVRAVDEKGDLLGVGTYSAKSSIAVRLFAFEDAVIDSAWFAAAFTAADARRRDLGLGPDGDTDGYRVVFGEADGVPGLVVDRYGDVLVVQLSTAGIDALRDEIVAALKTVFSPRAIVERSDVHVRKEEALDERVGVLFGDAPGTVEFLEDGGRFLADVSGGQKTGFYLDQRSLRRAIRTVAEGKRVLNLFSYSGAAGVAAMAAGAASVHNVDSSGAALELCRKHAALHGFDADAFTTEEIDVFQFLSAKEEPEYDMVIIDPPALIRSARDADEGRKAYHFLNRAALRLVKDGGVFVTSSCSRFMPEEDLAFILRRASVQSDVRLDIREAVRQAPDHPQSVYFPESFYLKSFVCRVGRKS